MSKAKIAQKGPYVLEMEPGRYAYYAEGTTPDGTHIRRSKTLYCMPRDWVAWGERPKAYLEFLPLDDPEEDREEK